MKTTPDRFYTSTCLFSSLALTFGVFPATAAAQDDYENTLGETVLLDELVVTGSMVPTTRRESSLSITTIDQGTLDVAAPRSTAEALKLIPGFYIESSGGESNNNLYARGVASEGGYEYVAIQEDGLPVIYESNMSFSPADNYTRITSFVADIEALRGGSASILQSSAPVGIVNFISRQGTQALQGEVSMTFSDYNTLRPELWVSGPISPNTTYAFGAFYRVDDGARDRGYTANKGGQISGNIRHDFSNGRGHIQVSGKLLNDRTAFELPIPVANPEDPHSIPGGPDINEDASASLDIRYFNFPDTPDGDLHWDLADGIYVDLQYIGTEIEYDLTDTLTIQMRNRYTHVDKAWNANPLGTATPLQTIANNIATSGNAAGQFAAALDETTGNYRFMLTEPGDGDQVVAANASEAAALNGNGLGIDNAFWHSAAELRNFQNDLRLLQSFADGTTVTLGYYYSYMEDDRYWQWNSFLTDVSPDYQRLDITYMDADGNPIGQGTYEGISQVGTNYLRFNGEETANAFYANVDRRFFDRLKVDAGIRYERLEAEGGREGTETYDLNQNGGTNPALRGAVFGNGAMTTGDYTVDDHAITFGANYTLNQSLSVFGRFSDGYRLPDTDNLSNALGAGTEDPGPTIGIKQYELGVKFGTNRLAFFLTGFATRVENQLFDDFIINPDGSISQQTSRLGIDIDGLELEALWNPIRGLSFQFIGTYQSPEFSTDNFVSGTDSSGDPISINIKGNRPVRIPELYFTATTTYIFPETGIGTPSVDFTWRYTGDRYSDQANLGVLDSFNEFALGLSLKTQNGFTFRVHCANLFNGDGITEGDPRAGQGIANPDAAYTNMRPILPRSIVGTVSYRF